MTDLPTIEELLENYENIPQDQLLAWWQSKGVKWNDHIQKSSAYTFFLALWQSGVELKIKMKILGRLPQLSHEQFNELIEIYKGQQKEVSTQRQLDNEQLIHIYNILPLEERPGFITVLTAIKKAEKKAEEFYASHRQKEAAIFFQQALNLYAQKSFQDLICFDPSYARTAANLGIILKSTGNYNAAIKSYKQAQNLFEGDYCKDRFELNPDRARIAMKLGNSLYLTGDYDAAIKSHKQAQRLFKGDYCKDLFELDPNRALTATNLGNALQSTGDYDAAIKSYRQAQRLFEGDYCKDRFEFDPYRARTAMNLGVALQSTGDYDAAIKSYKQTQKLYKGDYCKDRFELDPDRSRTSMNLGNSLYLTEDYDAAIKSHKQAQRLFKGDYCKDLFELDPSRARTAMNLGAALQSTGDYNAAIKSLKHAQMLLQGDYCKDHFELDPSRAGTAANLATALYSIRDYDAAIKSHKQAEQIYESKTMGHGLPLNKERCTLYANASWMLDKMNKPLVWAKEKSEHLIRMLELAPVKGTAADGTVSTWENMRRSFARFHANWLAFVIDQQKYEEIPRILFCIQGRELASELLDELGEAAGQRLPDQVKAYQKLRHRLRKMIQKKKGGRTGIIEPFDPGTRSLGRARQNKTLEAEQEAIAAYNRLHKQMGDARRKASGLPGFELLELPYDAFTLENIQAIPDFHSHQSLLLMINHEDVQGVLVIQKQGIPQWLPLNSMDELAKRTRVLTGERNSYLGNCRRNIHDDRQDKSDIPVMSARERGRFWPDMIRDLREKFWSPLQPYLTGNKELFILPQGSLHQLPVLAGKPKGVTTRFYPGLIYYALQTGLIKRNMQENGRSWHYPAALLYYDHRDNGKKFLAGVEKEVEAIKAVHQKNNSLCETLEYPAPFPNEPIEIDLLTGIGHGGDDSHMAFSTAMQVSKNQSLSYQDILSGKAKVRHAFFNTCLIAMNRDDSQGTPMGLSTGFIRKGTQSITGFLYPISDLLATHFGPIFHKHWLASKTKDPDRVLHKAHKEFMESTEDILSQILVQYWRPKLQREIADCTTVRKEVQEELINAFELDEDQAAIIARLINRHEGPEKELPDLLIKTVIDMKSFGSNDENPPLMAIGTILYGIRAYGR
ncbi:Tfp pilus assembly protein PilF [Desulfocicer vacuolatum DSM 3385]|uniref:Tfp pilus assembly protein PilF n=1 Tax=Desulfocicer vacuolatum DSM 3385 TaxID=1121400 RepID=A0A1W2EV44_9BACT|nr:tetratricopeptide repeat protein [Desulfocicer vacuolatum]SMD13028.1 Tfp pilus assembly protein PilF [Desulfocicer vacuolatum DSM 3385]